MTESLDLSAIFDRDTVKLGGTTYELRNRMEFSITQDAHLMKLIDQAGEFGASSEDASPDTLAQASQIMRELATLLVVDLKDEIPDLACVAIFDFWVGRLQPDAPGDADPQKPRRRTSAASSRGSKRSTAATRKTGTKLSRGGR